MNTYRFFALTIFVSSFLLFQIQPLISKHILPWFGGSSAVWVTAMFFFMVLLGVGYGYALWLTRLPSKKQFLIHGTALLLALGWLLWQKQLWSSSVTPSLSDLGHILSSDPTVSIIYVLLLTIGGPFVLLSSSSTLLQFWYARYSGQEPFSLYSVSNVGSLLGLVTFPFLFEPLLTTLSLGQGWFWLFGLYVVMIFVIGVKLWRKEFSQSSPVSFFSDSVAGSGLIQVRRWFLVASVPVFTMLSGTAFLTTAIAPIPLLWVGPLALYLISFIVSFRATTKRLPTFFNQVSVVMCSVLALVAVTSQLALSVGVKILLVHLAMFAIFHWCHEYLYQTRPDPVRLPVFYLALAGGGILGSLLMLVSTLYLLVLPVEMMLVCAGAVLVVVWQWRRHHSSVVREFFPGRTGKFVPLLVGFAALLLVVVFIYNKQTYALEMNRNFFGYKAVLEYPHASGTIRALQHGITNHGFQRVVEGDLVVEPASYYGETAGVGKAFSYLKQREASLQVVVLGLGAGGLTAYCRETDAYEFIEIDPQVINLAKNHFTYLEYCPQVVVTEADGRLALAEKPARPTYDLIILDAYADDMMPIHIMTNEALGIYKKLLKPDGIIAMNISSRYLDLLPVAAVLADSNDLAIRTWYDRNPDNPALVSSHWVLFGHDEEVFQAEEFASMLGASNIESRVTWTDTYSALWPIVKLW